MEPTATFTYPEDKLGKPLTLVLPWWLVWLQAIGAIQVVGSGVAALLMLFASRWELLWIPLFLAVEGAMILAAVHAHTCIERWYRHYTMYWTYAKELKQAMYMKEQMLTDSHNATLSENTELKQRIAQLEDTLNRVNDDRREFY